MTAITRDWGGVEARFDLRLGEVLDLEQCVGRGIGEIYTRLCTYQYSAKELFEVVRLALIGGGMTGDAARLMVRERFDRVPLQATVSVTLEILVTLMDGIPVDADRVSESADSTGPLDRAVLLASFAKLGIAPEALRKMRFDDFVVMMRGFNTKTSAPSEEEFHKMVADYEAQYGLVIGA